MTATLLYLVIAFSGPTWHGSQVLHTTADPARCERMAAQLSTTGRRYECHTHVVSVTGGKP